MFVGATHSPSKTGVNALVLVALLGRIREEAGGHKARPYEPIHSLWLNRMTSGYQLWLRSMASSARRLSRSRPTEATASTRPWRL
jgi:hypothetical protein